VLDVDLADPRSREDAARDVLLRMNAAGMRRAVLIGHSAGGAAAITRALQSPGRVLALVLVAMDPRPDTVSLSAITVPTRVMGYPHVEPPGGFHWTLTKFLGELSALAPHSRGASLGPLAHVIDRT